MYDGKMKIRLTKNNYLNLGRSMDDLDSVGFDFRSLLSTLVVFVAVVFEEIFRRIAASNSCSKPCGLSIFLGGGVRTSSGTILKFDS